MIVRNEFFGGFDSSSERPAAIYHIETIHQYLNMVARCGCAGEFEGLIVGVAELVVFEVCSLAVHSEGIFEAEAVMFYDFSGLIEGVPFALKLAPRSCGDFGISR